MPTPDQMGWDSFKTQREMKGVGLTQQRPLTGIERESKKKKRVANCESYARVGQNNRPFKGKFWGGGGQCLPVCSPTLLTQH